ncbi:MAG: glycosyltransferase family 4 protein [Bacteroidota bacterium]|nr:glycosyltransferase family 4 protein [Bacteroidota bacterium]
MRLIINCTNLRVGGGFQRSISFLNEIKTLGKDEYHVYLNPILVEQLDLETFPTNFQFYVLKDSPASLRTRRSIINEMSRLERKINPDLVFSFVGTAYWVPKSKHFVGYAIPHIVYYDFPFVKAGSWKTKLEMIYKRYWTKKEADFFVVQTEDVRERLSKVIGVSKEKIAVVSNGFGKQYTDAEVVPIEDSKLKKLLMISTFRPSKNFEIIKEVVPLLKGDEYEYEFHLTIRDEDFQRVFGDTQGVINHGHVFAKDCPALYNDCNAMFLPTHLECFSASYPEAMKMERPILTSDFSFARAVCGDAAIYFDNSNPVDIAEKIKALFANLELQQDLIERGRMRLESFDTPRNRAKKYLKICQNIVNDGQIGDYSIN